MMSLARAVAWQTRLLEQLVAAEEDLSLQQAAAAVTPLDRLAASFDEVRQAAEQAHGDEEAQWEAARAINSDDDAVRYFEEEERRQIAAQEKQQRLAALHLKDLKPFMDQGELIHTPAGKVRLAQGPFFAQVQKHDGLLSWHELEEAVFAFCPKVLRSLISDCDGCFEKVGGASSVFTVYESLRYAYPQQLKTYEECWDLMWEHREMHFRTDEEVLTFTLHHARMAQRRFIGRLMVKMLRTRCLVPGCGDTDHHVARDVSWDRFFTAAPARRRRCVSRSRVARRA